MKSILVRELKENGVRRIQVRKVELYSMYELVHFVKLLRNGEEIK